MATPRDISSTTSTHRSLHDRAIDLLRVSLNSPNVETRLGNLQPRTPESKLIDVPTQQAYGEVEEEHMKAIELACSRSSDGGRHTTTKTVSVV